MIPALIPLLFEEEQYEASAYQLEDLQSVHYQCLYAVQARIWTLGLWGFDNTNVVVRKTPWIDRELERDDDDPLKIALPAIIITPFGQEVDEGKLNTRDDIGYPITISIVDDDNQDQTSLLNRRLMWRQRLYRAFRNQRLDVDNVYLVRVTPNLVLNPGAFFKGYWSSSLGLRCINRETRGT